MWNETNNDTILYKKIISWWKILIYFFFIELILLLFTAIIFFTWTITPFNDTFKNNWNTNYLNNNVDYIKDEIKKYNIEYSKVTKCQKSWFYEENDLLYFCDDLTLYIFKTPTELTKEIEKNKDILIKFWVSSTIITIISLILLWSTNNYLFTIWWWIPSLNTGAKELELVLDEIEEYIDKKWTRLDYRLPTLESLALSVIQEEIDFFNRFSSRIKTLSDKAYDNHLNNAHIRLHILYKELEKKYFLKKWKYFHALSSELSLFLTKYNTSILWYIISMMSIIIISAFILYWLYQINWNNLEIQDSLKTVLNIITLRNANINIYNIYQEYYILFLQCLSYILFILSIKLIVNKK